MFFLDKSRNTSVLFPNTHACLLQIGKLIASGMIWTKATEFKGQCDSVFTPAQFLVALLGRNPCQVLAVH